MSFCGDQFKKYKNSVVHAGPGSKVCSFLQLCVSFLHSADLSVRCSNWILATAKNVTVREVMADLGKILIVLGVVLVTAGLLLTLFGRMNLPVGRLPGDILYRGKNTTFYFPLATSIL